MKILVFGDTQYYNNINRSKLLPNGRSSWLEEQINLTKSIFDYALTNDISIIIHTGDLFEEKSKVNTGLIKEIWGLYNNYKNLFSFYFNQGNHDITSFQDRSKSLLYLFREIGSVIFGPAGFYLGKSHVVFCPHKSTTDYDQYLKKNSYNILVLHENIDTHYPNEPSIDSDIFKNWDLVLNGHIHQTNIYKNIINVGSFMQQDFSEEGQGKYFVILDGLKYTLHPIPHPVFTTITKLTDDLRTSIMKNEHDYFRIKIDSSAIDDPIFQKHNVTPFIIPSKKRVIRLINNSVNKPNLVEEITTYIKLFKPESLDADRLSITGQQLVKGE